MGIGENRDTLYSLGVFDLTEPVTITKPETGGRYQSMLVQNEDQYLKLSTTRPGKYTITREQAGTRYIGVNFRTFVDPNDPVDVRQVQELQNEIVVEQASAGSFEIPNWDRESYRRVDAAFRTLYYTMDDWSNAFGDVDQVDPVKFYVASASGWTGVPEPSEALILQGAPSRNDGKTPHTLTVRDVPVDGFWSVTVYDRDLAIVKNSYDAYIVNSVTAEPNDDGSVTIHFDGDPDQPNFIYIPEGWRYLVRLYGTREAIVDGSFQFPEPQPVA
ncbi:DUF1214 domain-containing protein [Rhodococcus sp. 14C212]|uniref:DUF1214 domain-containing protein n=1 Tax=Rhodococcus sp. 14C212 TaxID=2711209 RepID=UPI00197E3920|nr:DUF1214 domain-containing protein [Rhodococcus sp. 14C212]